MESMGRDVRRGPWSYYREQTGSNSYTSSSGTVSTAYTSTSSRLSWMSMEAARHFQEMEMEDPVSMKMEAVMDFDFVQSPKETASGMMKMKQIKILAKEFFGAPLTKCRAEGGDLSVLERWFRELDIGWVLHIADGAPAGELAQTLDASSWIPALVEIVDTFCHGCAEEEEPATKSEEQLHLARFTQQAMLKMLTFVDFIVAPNLTCEVFIADGAPVPAPSEKLHTLLRVCEALSKALFQIWLQLQFNSSYSTEVEGIQFEIINVLSENKGKVYEAIWIALEEVRARILGSLEDAQDSSGTQTLQGSADIDKATTSVMMCVMFLQHNYLLVSPIVSEAASLGKYVPRVRAVQPLTSLAVEMVSCLEEKLANKSEAFPDQSLRFLFLLNNSSFIADKLRDIPYFPKSYMEDLAGKVEGYMERYIHVSWAPMLSCLINSTPNCFGKNYSPLPKFESEFQRMYTTQKLWKVPDPRLRNRLRGAIIDEVIPGYTRYLADDNKNAPLKFSPSDPQEMLQELFEG